MTYRALPASRLSLSYWGRPNDLPYLAHLSLDATSVDHTPTRSCTHLSVLLDSRHVEAEMTSLQAQKAASIAKNILPHCYASIARARIQNRKTPDWPRHAYPYLDAMARQSYGLEPPGMIIAYALNNLINWRGAEARKLKMQLNHLLKELQ